MPIAVEFHPLAAQEARAAATWYARHSAEVAERFRAATLSAVEAIRNGVDIHRIGKSRFH